MNDFANEYENLGFYFELLFRLIDGSSYEHFNEFTQL